MVNTYLSLILATLNTNFNRRYFKTNFLVLDLFVWISLKHGFIFYMISLLS